jgi:hypothetical protein
VVDGFLRDTSLVAFPPDTDLLLLANVMKQYLKNLPEPLLDSNEYAAVVQVEGIR